MTALGLETLEKEVNLVIEEKTNVIKWAQENNAIGVFINPNFPIKATRNIM